MKSFNYILSTAFLLLSTITVKADGLKINLGNDNFTSSTELIFTPTSTAGFEKGLDREYRKAPGNKMNYIYSLAGSKHELYVNYLQRPSTYLPVELQMVVQQAGTFYFSVEDRANNLTDFQFSLTDLETGKTIAVIPEALTEITFETRDVHKKKNFILHMFPVIKVTASPVSCGVSKNGTVGVQFNPGCEWTATLKNAASAIIQTEKCSGDQFRFDNLAAGIYYVEISMNNVLVCEEMTAVSKPAGLQAKFTLSSDTVYQDKRISTDNLSMGGDRWHWDFGDGSTVQGYDVSHVYTTPGNYTVTLTTANISGCISTSDKTITVVPAQAKPFAIKTLSTY